MRLLTSAERERATLLADLWCTAFFQPKRRGEPAITQRLLDRVARCDDAALDELDAGLWGLTDRLSFLHWHVAFPHVFRVDEDEEGESGWAGGFDVVLGNPPWEHTELKEKEFFAVRHPAIVAASNKTARERMIKELEHSDPALFAEWQAAQRDAEGVSHLIRNSGRYPMCGRGRINTYAVFAETSRSIVGRRGRVGCIVPTGIATDDTTKLFFQELMEGQTLVSLYDFENRQGVFPGVHRSYKFCLLTLVGPERADRNGAMFVFFATRAEHLDEPHRRFTLGAADIALLNPDTRTCPTFRTARDAELTKAIYRRVPVLVREGDPDGNPWDLSFKQGLFNMASDSDLFRTAEELEADGWTLDGNAFARDGWRMLPLYEAKMLHHFDQRYGDYAMHAEGSQNTQLPDVPPERLDDPTYAPLPRYWVDESEVRARLAGRWDREWLLGWRNICRSTDERTGIFFVLPRTAVGHSTPLILSTANAAEQAALLACLVSFAVDYATRNKVGGTNFTFGFLRQLPIPAPAAFRARPSPAPDAPLTAWLTPRVLELTYTADDLAPFARDLGYNGPPSRWDPDRRFLLRAELDAAFFHIYGIERDDVDYILDTFPIVRRKDERAHGEYRTKRVILEIHDAMTQAAAAGVPYQTLLDPPPADPRVAHRAPAGLRQ